LVGGRATGKTQGRGGDRKYTRNWWHKKNPKNQGKLDQSVGKCPGGVFVVGEPYSPDPRKQKDEPGGD